MDKPSEEHIETYIRYPSDLSTKEIIWIEEWIEKDCELRLLADWFRDYYNTVDLIEKSTNDTDEKPSYIRLKSSKEEKRFSSNFSSPTTQIQALSRKNLTLKPVRTFISDDHKTSIRVLHDKVNNQFKLYVVSEFVGEDDLVIIKIPEKKLTFVSELGGFISIPESFSLNDIKGWNQCELYLPLSKVYVYCDKKTNFINIDSFDIDTDKLSIQLEVINHEAKITIDQLHKSPPQKMVIHREKETHLRMLEEGVCRVPIEDFSTSVSKLFFFEQES